MNVLCLNTAFKTSDIAVLYNGEKALKQVDSNLKQSENVLVCIDEILKSINADIENVDCFACVVGPGSFTGIRVGVALVKGFCATRPAKKLVEVVSLDLMAYTYFKNEKPSGDFWCVINALSGNIFACCYSERGEKKTDYTMFNLEDFDSNGATIVGLFDDLDISLVQKRVEFNPNMLLDFVLQKINNNIYTKNLNPIYLRLSQAEANLEKNNDNKKN